MKNYKILWSQLKSTYKAWSEEERNIKQYVQATSKTRLIPIKTPMVISEYQKLIKHLDKNESKTLGQGGGGPGTAETHWQPTGYAADNKPSSEAKEILYKMGADEYNKEIKERNKESKSFGEPLFLKEAYQRPTTTEDLPPIGLSGRYLKI